MKAIGLHKYLPIDNEQSLIDLTIDIPKATGHDIVVKVKAISVNPVDTKVRAPKDNIETTARILGWDASGIVTAIGDKVQHFKVGDEVYYAGDITRAGSNSEYHCVDETIVGKKPNSLNFASAAAMPLTTITAWEALFERLAIDKNGGVQGKSILIIGGAGGVGSIATQLASKVAGLTVIATASRQDTVNWCNKMGAHHIINHHKSLSDELSQLDISHVDYILCLNNIDQHWSAMCELIAAQGLICSIVEAKNPLDMNPLKSKSAGLVWEFMFTRSMCKTQDRIKQQQLLNKVSQLIDDGVLQSTMNKVISPLNAENLRKAHALLESNQTIGKIVLSDW